MTQVYRFQISTELAHRDPDALKRIVRDRLKRVPVDLQTRDVVLVTVQPIEAEGEYVEVEVYSGFDERHPVVRVVFALARRWARKMVGA